MADVKDNMTRFGAGALAERIEAYWHARGHTSVRAERYPTGFGGDDPVFGVRSNLVNGRPPFVVLEATSLVPAVTVGLAAFNRLGGVHE
jgi:hypothetical protein